LKSSVTASNAVTQSQGFASNCPATYVLGMTDRVTKFGEFWHLVDCFLGAVFKEFFFRATFSK
jgi:hypothetical protein